MCSSSKIKGLGGRGKDQREVSPMCLVWEGGQDFTSLGVHEEYGVLQMNFESQVLKITPTQCICVTSHYL